MCKDVVAFLIFLFAATPSNAQQGIDSLMIHHQYDRVVEKLLQYDTLSISERTHLAEAQQKLGKLYDALDSYTALYRADSNHAYLLQQARILEKVDEDPKALQVYIQLNKLEQENVYYWKLTARSAYKNASFPFSLQAWKEVHQRNPEDLEAIDKMALLYNKLDQPALADSLLKKGLQIAPEAKFLKRSRIKTLYRLRKYQALVDLADELFMQGDSNLVVQKIAGIANYHEKNYPKCLLLLGKVAEVETGSELVHFYMGLAYRDSGDNEEAGTYLEKAIELSVSKNIGNYYTQLAVNFEEAGETAKAIQAYKVAYSESKNKILLYHLARNYDSYYKDKKVALTYYERYLQEKDTANEYLMNYSMHRIQELKNAAHFEGKSF